MSETQFLGLPLLEPAQAQKHVTVNEALLRLDGLAQPVLEDVELSTPPAQIEGAYGIGAGATDAWFGQDGHIAIAANGGWEFVAPSRGWRAWIASNEAHAISSGSAWISDAQSLSANGAGIDLKTIETDHVLTAGSSSTTVSFLPAQSVVYAVTGRVLTDLTGTASSFSLGIAGESPDRYGSGLGLAAGSWLRGLTSSPLAYYSDTALTLTAENGDFSGGTIRLSAHVMTFRLPG